MKHYVHVAWGECPDEIEPSIYTFDSQAEADAFTQGINLTLGWQDALWQTTNNPNQFYRYYDRELITLEDYNDEQ